MKTRIAVVTLLAFFGLAAVAFAAFKNFDVKPGEFEPEKTPLVNAAWLNGIGCPTNAKTAAFNADFTDIVPGAPYTDPACLTGDPKDKKVEGLLLVKTGPTGNAAAAGADLKHVKGVTLTELGYDIRKPGLNNDDPRGSHCGAGAPRFNVETTSDFYFIGCNSPEPTSSTPGDGFMRLRWGGGTPGSLMGFDSAGVLVSVTGTVKSIQIILDEGQDASGGPDNFGLAVLDNIDVNGVLVGEGPTNPN